MPDTSLVAAGAAACAVAAFFWRADSKAHRSHEVWCAGAAKAEGFVSRIGRRGHLSRNAPTSSDSFYTVPIVRFRAADGVEYEIDAADAPKTVGAPLQVAYDPNLPSGARPVPRTRKIGCSVVLLAIGIFLVGWGMTH
ncbi:MAG TPA: DUF3592 domain-containing protein [Thermoanaerobaculia bacterium]|nr:DUF3592 domain-containing protein [Thermoanaerobaculia bacterium]